MTVFSNCARAKGNAKAEHESSAKMPDPSRVCGAAFCSRVRGCAHIGRIRVAAPTPTMRRTLLALLPTRLHGAAVSYAMVWKRPGD